MREAVAVMAVALQLQAVPALYIQPSCHASICRHVGIVAIHTFTGCGSRTHNAAAAVRSSKASNVRPMPARALPRLNRALTCFGSRINTCNKHKPRLSCCLSSLPGLTPAPYRCRIGSQFHPYYSTACPACPRPPLQKHKHAFRFYHCRTRNRKHDLQL